MTPRGLGGMCQDPFGLPGRSAVFRQVLADLLQVVHR
jgi:hypothetical protein